MVCFINIAPPKRFDSQRKQTVLTLLQFTSKRNEIKDFPQLILIKNNSLSEIFIIENIPH
ncbi:Hypothetical protein SRAE_0000074350 [Strongyloides ratti]|uniref:Uncharacterized protein n=1 Tax=Strongyloides ratti TaxID=34506 RepID=A0A090L0H5_STRRB|nr:Hypothetical protein SRAE_0000074350 [Strongyloides ratti]CEF61627.1 Hypothetical protein SRAE_0000074350 [Strongyloides ratti]